MGDGYRSQVGLGPESLIDATTASRDPKRSVGVLTSVRRWVLSALLSKLLPKQLGLSPKGDAVRKVLGTALLAWWPTWGIHPLA